MRGKSNLLGAKSNLLGAKSALKPLCLLVENSLKDLKEISKVTFPLAFGSGNVVKAV